MSLWKCAAVAVAIVALAWSIFWVIALAKGIALAKTPWLGP